MRETRRSERQLWNEKYSQGSHTSLKPDPFLLSAWREFVEPLHPRPGMALDVAGGIGRHSLWLAAKGWQVTLAEVSDMALERAQQNARRRSLQFDLMMADLNTPAGRSRLAAQRYGLVLVFFYLERKLFPFLLEALKPGGLLLYKTYTVDQLRFRGRPTHPSHLLKPNELLHAFHKLRVLHYRETVKQKGVAEFVGVKGT